MSRVGLEALAQPRGRAAPARFQVGGDEAAAEAHDELLRRLSAASGGGAAVDELQREVAQRARYLGLPWALVGVQHAM